MKKMSIEKEIKNILIEESDGKYKTFLSFAFFKTGAAAAFSLIGFIPHQPLSVLRD